VLSHPGKIKMTYGIVDNKDDMKGEQATLARIKANIERSVLYWKPNAKRFHQFQRFTFKTALTTSDQSSLNAAQKPILEFNIINAPLSRQCGEFSKQEPSIEVSARAGKQVDPKVIEFIDGHLRYIFDEAKKHNVQYGAYRDSMSGGYSQLKYENEYESEMSFDQVIRVTKTYNPTMTGFDPNAKEVDKSDAEFYYEIFPMDREEFKRKYKDIPLDQLQFTKIDGMFNWSFRNQEQYVVILAHYYEKVRTSKDIVLLANNQTMIKKEYEKKLEKYIAEGHIEQPPEIIEERKADFVHIKRYTVMESKILEQKDTLYKHNNIVFVDGDSVVIQDEDNSNMEQFTKPYVYHAEGLQRLTNFTGQVIGNDFENMVMHKFMIAEEALPVQEDAIDAWTNPQQAQLLVYKAYADFDPNKPLPLPQPVNRIGLPPEVLATFNNSMQMLQNILGSYDASLAQASEQQISGVAIVEAATLSNAAAMPYVVNYMQALTQLANGIIDLIPKLNKRARELPIIRKDGTKHNVKINQDGGVMLNYNSTDLQVKVEAGVNFAIAKNKALQQLTLLMKVSPEFAAFMNEVGLETLLDNIEFRNSDLLRAKVKQWQQMKEEQKKQQPNPEMIKAQAAQQQAQNQAKQIQLAEGNLQNEMQKTHFKSEELQAKTALDTERLVVEKEKADNERLDIMLAAGESKDKMESALAKAEAEEFRALTDLKLKAHHQDHTQFKELGELAIKHHSATKPEPKKHEEKK
jgi:hypothetical protein